MKETKNFDILENASAVFEKLREEALDLEMADKFLASVEQKNRMVSGLLFDATRLHQALTDLAARNYEDDGADFENAELIAESELASWRETLELRNNMIETYHIRRFYDNSEAPLDIGLLVSLTRVFCALPYSESNQSKYDLVVTRLFTKGHAETRRNLRLPRKKIEESLAAIVPKYPESDSTEDIDSIVKDFDRFIAYLKPLSDLADFIDRDSFEALRQFKKELGQSFYHPRVSAAAIECNVTIGNVFGGLINHVNGPLYDLINNRFDFAGTFHDVSPSAKSMLCDEFNLEESGDENLSSIPGHENIKELLGMIAGVGKGVAANGEEQNEPGQTAPDANLIEKAASDLVNEFLLMLSVENPDYTAIRDELDEHGVLMSIDLGYVFGGTSEVVNEICRGVLALIIWTEELCANNLEEMDQFSAKSKSQALTLIQLSEKYQCDLHMAIERFGEKEQNRLLTVSNRLLASHLDLKRMLVEFTRKCLEEFEADEAVLEAQPQECEILMPAL